MRYLLLILLVLPTIAVAQPAIDHLEGTTAHANSVILYGTDFGVKSPAAPLKWETFEAGSNGATLGSIQPEWVPYASDGALYSDTDSHSGQLSVTNNTSRSEFATNYIDLPESEAIFVSYWWGTKQLDTNDYGVVKLTRVNSSVEAGGEGRYNGVGETFLSNFNPGGPDAPYFAYNNGEGNTGPLGYIGVPYNDWGRIDMYKSLSTPGVANGDAFCRNVSNGRAVVRQDVVTRADGYDFRLDTVLLGLMMANAQGTYSLWMDDVYIDNTLARVEIGDNEQFDLCRHREMQIPVTWDAAGATIEIEFNAGTFATDDNAWLFVVDADGNASQGYPIVIGQSVEGPGRVITPNWR